MEQSVIDILTAIWKAIPADIQNGVGVLTCIGGVILMVFVMAFANKK